MDRSNGLERQHYRETIDVKDGWRLLVKPITIRQFIISQAPRDISVFTFITFEWNGQQRSPYCHYNKNEAGREEDGASTRPHVLAMKPIVLAREHNVVNGDFRQRDNEDNSHDYRQRQNGPLRSTEQKRNAGHICQRKRN